MFTLSFVLSSYRQPFALSLPSSSLHPPMQSSSPFLFFLLSQFVSSFPHPLPGPSHSPRSLPSFPCPCSSSFPLSLHLQLLPSFPLSFSPAALFLALGPCFPSCPIPAPTGKTYLESSTLPPPRSSNLLLSQLL